MIEDGRQVAADRIETDVCVIGAGPAGLALALELAGHGLSVCVLESGDRGISRRGQQLAGGENGDPHYYRLDSTRIRGFGGTSNHWRGDSGFRARELDAADLAPRPSVGRIGWPFSRAELAGDYERAAELLRLGPDVTADRWAEATAGPLPTDPDLIETWRFRIGPLDSFTSRWDELDRLRDVRVLTSTTVLELHSDDHRVTEATATTGDGRTLEVHGRAFVLAMGGIDNARLLLLSRRDRPAGLGNHHDRVGRYFMEHPHVRSGVLVPRDPTFARRMQVYDRHDVDGTELVGMLAPSSAALERVGALGSAWSVHMVPRARLSAAGQLLSEVRDLASYRRPVPRTGARIAGLLRRPGQTARAVRAALGDGPPEVGMLVGMTEQEPHPDSRVTLGGRRDRFGQPVARLDWRLTERDRAAVRAGQDILDRALRDAGLGHVEDRFGDVEPPPLIGGGFHHMGTTRMHDDERLGVVDADQRVHTMSNLYVTGASVFPTGGVANPTLTVVALAVRLARHLRGSLRTAG
ncbi:MAG: GMC family oxidoreductase [Actinobacteria bacterium]|nr:GMC family oxidoreductase [Actinomycetota bacterium]